LSPAAQNNLATGHHYTVPKINLLNPGQLYSVERTNLVDMRFAKIFRFVGRRTDVGIDLCNLFNSNVTAAYQQDLRVRDQRRRVAAPDGLRAAAAGAVPHNVQPEGRGSFDRISCSLAER
jgi:hypothetical protein